MAKRDWYSIETSEKGFLVRKFDDNFEPNGTYTLTIENSETIHCDCVAGLMGKFCRHRQLIPIFGAAEAIGTGRLYNFDRAQWWEPVGFDAEAL